MTVAFINVEPLPFRIQKNLPLHVNKNFVQPSSLGSAQGAHAHLFLPLFLTTADQGLALTRTVAQGPRSRMAKHALMNSYPSSLLVRFLPFPSSEYVNDTDPEFPECLHWVHRVAERFEPRSAVVFQLASDRGWVRDVDLVREAFDV